MRKRTIPSPLGPLTLTEDDGAVVRLFWGPARSHDNRLQCNPQSTSILLAEAKAQLTAYFEGRLERFDLPWRVGKSPQQRAACALMAAIPFGETRSYGELARQMSVSAQAMGQLCGANPLPILVPCHRVLGANGLGGFSGQRGIEDKVWLLRHEGAASLLI